MLSEPAAELSGYSLHRYLINAEQELKERERLQREREEREFQERARIEEREHEIEKRRREIEDNAIRLGDGRRVLRRRRAFPAHPTRELP